MFYTPLNPAIIFQGDIISNFNFIFSPLEKPTDSNLNIPQNIRVTNNNGSNGQILANLLVTNAMIVSQSCDIQRREFISLCPVFLVSKMVEDLRVKNFEETRIEGMLTSLKGQKIDYWLYLPPYSDNDINLEESYVDLQKITSVPRGNLKNYKRIIAMNDRGRHHLAFKLAVLFGRPF